MRSTLSQSIAVVVIIAGLALEGCGGSGGSGTGPTGIALATNTGAGYVAAWGDDTQDQLGLVPCCAPTRTPLAVNSLGPMGDVAAADNHSLAIDVHGAVWEWGNCCGAFEAFPACGHTCHPVNVSGLPPIVQVAPGGQYQGPPANPPYGRGRDYALDRGGHVWVWGDGLLGLGDQRTSGARPVRIKTLSNIVSIATQRWDTDDSTFAVSRDGAVWAWGQLREWGLSRPRKLTGIGNALAVAAGNDGFLALKHDGSVWDLTRLIGDRDRSPATQVKGLRDAVKIFASDTDDSAFYAIERDGSLWAWGSNEAGQLGIPALKRCFLTCRSAVARRILGLSHVVDVAAGDHWVMALESNGSVWAWGLNRHHWLPLASANAPDCGCVTSPGRLLSLGRVLRLAGGSGHALVIETTLPPHRRLPAPLAVRCPLPAGAPTGPFPHTVHVGFRPDALVASETQARVFVVSAGPTDSIKAYRCPGTITTLDAHSGAILRSVRVGTDPGVEQISEKLHRLVVANQGDAGSTATNAQGSVSIMDTRTSKLVATTRLGAIPSSLVISGAAGTALVLTHPVGGDHTTRLSLVDLITGKVLRTLSNTPADVGVDAHSGRFVLSTRRGLLLLDGRTGVPTQSMNTGPCNGGSIAVDASSRHVLVVGPGADICIVNLATGTLEHTAESRDCSGGDMHPDLADHRLFLTLAALPDRGSVYGVFCAVDTGTGKVIDDENYPDKGIDAGTIDSPAGVIITTTLWGSDYFLSTEARSIRTGKIVHKLNLRFGTSVADAQTGMLFLVRGHSVTAFDPRAWKATRAQSVPADISGPVQIVSRTHRLFAGGGSNPTGGVVTVFCTAGDGCS